MSHDVALGIIGFGGMGQAHAKALLGGRVPGVRLAAIADINARKLEHGRSLGVPAAFAEYRELLSRADIEAVYIATPNGLHAEHALAALAAGKDVFLEKPATTTSEDTAAVLEAAARSDRILMVDLPMRARKSSVWLKDRFERGLMGELYYHRARYFRRNLIPGKGGWFTHKRQSGGGVMMDLGVHILDRMCWMAGADQPVAVTGAVFKRLIAGTESGGWPPPDTFAEGDRRDFPVDVEDLAAATVRFANGAVLQVEASWAGFSAEGMEFEWLATRGGVREQGATVTVFGPGAETTDAKPLLDAMPAPARPMSQFLEAVRTRQAPPLNPEIVLAVSRIITAAYQSAETGREVRLDAAAPAVRPQPVRAH